MLWLGADLETTGLDLKNDKITEIGAVLWDTDRKSPVSMLSSIIYHEDLKLSKEITDLTGITDSDIENYGKQFDIVCEELLTMVLEADYIVAHNGASFDKPFLLNALEPTENHDLYGRLKELSWIDTKTDLPYSSKIKQTNLSLLAAQHGFLNPFAHRALFDVMTMLKMASHYDIKEVLRLQASPMVELIAKVEFRDKHLARDNGFYWEPDEKVWKRNIKDIAIADLKLPFRCLVRSGSLTVPMKDYVPHV